MKKDHQLVWVGFSDGKPHVYTSGVAETGCVAVYRTKREAKRAYEDVRRAALVFSSPRRDEAGHK